MKKTNEEILEFFGLRVGDKVKIEGFAYPLVIFEESGIQYVAGNWICNYAGIKLDIIDFIHKLLGNDYEIIKHKKKLGEVQCNEIKCFECPFRAICGDSPSGETLSEIFETHEKRMLELREKLNAIRTKLDKDVEEK